MARRTTYGEDRDLAEMLNSYVEVSAINIGLDAEVVLACIADNFMPEDVFDDEALVRWAEDNGYVKGK